MTLSQLSYLVALAAERHFGRAAARCCVSQSALSMGLKALEAELGQPLFERDRQGVRPTPVGLSIVARANTALEHCANIKALADHAQAPLALGLNMGVCPAYASYYAPRLASSLSGASRIEFTEAGAPQLLRQLQQRQLDVVLSSRQTAAGIACRTVTHEPLVAVLRRHDALAQHAPLPLAQCHEQRLWLPAGTLRHDITHGCAALLAGVSQVQPLEVSVPTLLQHLSVTGGMTVLPLSLASHTHLAADGLVARAFATEFTRPVALLWRESFTRRQDINTLAQAVANLSSRACWSQLYGAPEALLVDNNYW